MLSKAEAKYVRISARKVRLVLDLVKGKTVEDAVAILDNVNKRAAGLVRKVVNSAFANANHERQEKLLSKDVIISGIRANGGPMLKRFRAATMGRASAIRHRTAHIRVELDEAPDKKVVKRDKKVATQNKKVATGSK